MSEFLTIRGVKFRKKAFAKWSFESFKATFEKQVPYKKIDPRYREAALKEDFEKLTGNKPGKREKKTFEVEKPLTDKKEED